MKKIFIVGNWKSNKTLSEARVWKEQLRMISHDAEIILSIPFTLLSSMRSDTYSLAAQDVSPFPEGAYTGEVSARQIKEFADWVLIGHSERRKYFFETDEMLMKKVEQSKSAGLKVIYCVPDDRTFVPENVDIIAYEPLWAIGTGKTDTPEHAHEIIQLIKKKTKVETCIYGGSVTEKNVKSFVIKDAIDGILPGGASLDPESFSQLIKAATSRL